MTFPSLDVSEGVFRKESEFFSIALALTSLDSAFQLICSVFLICIIYENRRLWRFYWVSMFVLLLLFVVTVLTVQVKSARIDASVEHFVFIVHDYSIQNIYI